MGTEGLKGPVKGVGRKIVLGDLQKDSDTKVVVKKQLPRKIQPIPESEWGKLRQTAASSITAACKGDRDW
ncbi:hypothetical protein SAY87_014986 [Trapa incisa]|uniref:Uncharacterized protein n=1 Tax=Trapa incisa TaxID=236973 RepID=A0AAN7GKY3_9MYRT|nr:hypothetical protein SAY87_014986 [Trapa incisa]